MDAWEAAFRAHVARVVNTPEEHAELEDLCRMIRDLRSAPDWPQIARDLRCVADAIQAELDAEAADDGGD